MRGCNSKAGIALGLRASIALAVLVLAFGGACNDPIRPSATGSLSVTAPATGIGIPSTSGTVTVDDTAPRPLALNGTVTYAALGTGNHVVAFSGVQAAN